MNAPRPALPNTGMDTSGRVACNEPLTHEGLIVGYCEVMIKRHKPWHRGPHQVTWWSR